jgi:hypothetical protein
LEAGYAGVIKASVESEFGISATVTMGLSIGCNVNVPPNECYFVYLASQVMKNKKVTQAVSHKYTRTDTMTYGIGCECFTTCSSTTSVIASKDGDRVLTAPGCNWYVAPRPCCGE